MSIIILKKITFEKSHKFVDMIYKNFIELCNYEELKHNKKELKRLVTCQTAKILLIMVNKKIAAYLVGKVMELNDGRRVFYISYIYTSKHFRRQGFCSKLLNFVEDMSKKFGFDGIMLTCDTENEQIYNFYLMRGFMPDLILRKYDKHDVMYKKI